MDLPAVALAKAGFRDLSLDRDKVFKGSCVTDYKRVPGWGSKGAIIFCRVSFFNGYGQFKDK
jgi:hypothetical protein